jgi:UDP-N-acetylmuramyl pentapeptide synthase
MVAEISLGGTGLADCGILTSFAGDYRIAAGTRWASTAKLQMVSLAKEGSKLVANTDTGISADVSFGSGGQVRAEPDRLIFGKQDLPLQLGPDLDFPGYQTALAAAGAAAQAAGLSGEDIACALRGFDGFSGRMKIIRQPGLTVFDCSNSGLKVRDVAYALDRARGGRLAVVVGEESETVCEGMDILALVSLLRQRREEINLLVLVGERLRPWAGELEAATAQDLAAGLDLARAGAAGLQGLLSCVKCFR